MVPEHGIVEWRQNHRAIWHGQEQWAMILFYKHVPLYRMVSDQPFYGMVSETQLYTGVRNIGRWNDNDNN